MNPGDYFRPVLLELLPLSKVLFSMPRSDRKQCTVPQDFALDNTQTLGICHIIDKFVVNFTFTMHTFRVEYVGS